METNQQKKYKGSIEIKASDSDKASKTFKVLQNIADNVNELDFIALFEKIEKDPTFFKTVTKKMNSTFLGVKLF